MSSTTAMVRELKSRFGYGNGELRVKGSEIRVGSAGKRARILVRTLPERVSERAYGRAQESLLRRARRGYRLEATGGRRTFSPHQGSFVGALYVLLHSLRLRSGLGDVVPNQRRARAGARPERVVLVFGVALLRATGYLDTGSYLQ